MAYNQGLHCLSLKKQISFHCIVDPNTNCWFWKSEVTKNKMPIIALKHNKHCSAKAVSFKAYVCNDYPHKCLSEFTNLLSSCNNNWCVSPKHLQYTGKQMKYKQFNKDLFVF